ncbi:MAG: helix-turn-helix transcriptional regulator [Kiritimatiellaeota bacterium]|nr:helix-turn-helix transcriptional regulator [Kiritimatiellota bacterium]
MSAASLVASRFREFRERAGLSPDEAAKQMGISAPCVWDIETDADDLTCCYSLKEANRFCKVLGVHPRELFAVETVETPVSAEELVRRIHEECRFRGVTLEQFEDAVGWRLSACIEPPEYLLEGITIDGLQWLCRELHIHWHRVILAL